MDSQKREAYRRRLLEERERLRGTADRLKGHGLEETQSGSLGELSTYDNHPADIGSETFERSQDLALWLHARSRLARVEEALARLEAGTYGTCRACGRAVGEERLEAVPEADLCRECQGERERAEREHGRRRPVEEELLSPPFGRTFLDHDRRREGGNVVYDGEDAWQEVARYGTSETPQDVPDNAGYERMYQDGFERRGGVTEVENLADETGEPLLDRLQGGKGRGRTGREGR